MDSFKKYLANAHYFCVLSDGSTDTSVIEEEVVYLLFLKSGKSLLKFLSLEPANNANAEGIIQCIEAAFERIGILALQERITGLNVDGASVNTGVHNRVGVLVQTDLPWLQVMHFFNHGLELAFLLLFKSLVSLLDVSSWPKELSDFWSAEIDSLKAHFGQLLSTNGCDDDFKNICYTYSK